MADTIVKKRILKDLKLLEDNKSLLEELGIFVHINENNLHVIHVLIIPKHKSSENLVSPYKNGFFMFYIELSKDYPLIPPNVTFFPNQNYCRLHPNYYKNGKCCLSMINTWGKEDWSPSMSILSLINVLEERLNENSLRFEPGYENANDQLVQSYNEAVRFAVYKVAIVNVLDKKYGEYEIFQDLILDYFRKHKNEYLDEIKNKTKKTMTTFYHDKIDINYDEIMQQFENLDIKYSRF